MYRIGLVTDAKPGFAKVKFADLDDLVTIWLPVIHPNTLDNKHIHTLSINSQVACVMDDYAEDGCILGSIYSDVDLTPTTLSTVTQIAFVDGASISYDTSNGTMSITTKGELSINVNGNATLQVSGNLLIQAVKMTIDAMVEFVKLCKFNAPALFSAGIGGGGGAGSTIPGTVKADVLQTNSGIDLANHHHTEQGDAQPTSGAQA